MLKNKKSNNVELESLFSEVTNRRNDKFVSMLRGKFNPEDIKNKLLFFSEYIKTHEVKSPEGFIFDSLRKDYEPNTPVVKKIRIPCQRCKGDGYIVDPKTGDISMCYTCEGRGKVAPRDLKKVD